MPRLLEKVAYIKSKGDDGITPLHRALFSQQSEVVVRLLLSRRADINAKDSQEITALQLAVERRS